MENKEEKLEKLKKAEKAVKAKLKNFLCESIEEYEPFVDLGHTTNRALEYFKTVFCNSEDEMNIRFTGGYSLLKLEIDQYFEQYNVNTIEKAPEEFKEVFETVLKDCLPLKIDGKEIYPSTLELKFNDAEFEGFDMHFNYPVGDYIINGYTLSVTEVKNDKFLVKGYDHIDKQLIYVPIEDFKEGALNALFITPDFYKYHNVWAKFTENEDGLPIDKKVIEIKYDTEEERRNLNKLLQIAKHKSNTNSDIPEMWSQICQAKYTKQIAATYMEILNEHKKLKNAIKNITDIDKEDPVI